jgi:hypothetical protein
VGPRAGLDDVERRKFLTLPGLEFQRLGRPARSQSIYQLRLQMRAVAVSMLNNYLTAEKEWCPSFLEKYLARFLYLNNIFHYEALVFCNTDAILCELSCELEMKPQELLL